MAPASELLLAVWEYSHNGHPIERALALLDAAWPEVGVENWALAPVGQRDCCLLNLYECLFGAELTTIARCPDCSERLESTFATYDVQVGEPTSPVSLAPRQLCEDGYEIEYRLPTSRDLLEIAASGLDTVLASIELKRRCVLEARHGGRVVNSAELPDPIVARLGEQIAHDDPDAEISVCLNCPSCGHIWRVVFDIVAHFWGELDDWVHRVLLDIHTLASAYGWGEREILAMSPARRQLYVDMVQT